MNFKTLNFYGKIRYFFIGRLLEKQTDVFKQAKIKLIYDLSMILIWLLVPVTIQLAIRGLYVNSGFTTFAIAGLTIVVFLLKYHSAVDFAAKFYVFMGLTVLGVSCLLPTNTLVLANEVWFIVQVLFTLFVLGRKWAIWVSVASAAIMMYHVNFQMYDNLHNEAVYSSEAIQAILFIIPIEFFAVFYIVNQFLKTRDYAENEVRQMNEELLGRNKLIEKQRNEKAAMIREIHHRVKNNLQIVNSLLRLQSHQITDEKVLELFEESQNRVITMALLHENLYKTDELKRIDISDHLRLLATDLIKTYSVGKNIGLDLNVDKIEFGSKTMVPLGLIINEIITNSLKYAFPEIREGRIVLDLKSLGDNRFELLIGDDGIGISQLHNSSGEKRFGTELVDLFIDQLDGEMELLPVKGTKYRILFSGND